MDFIIENLPIIISLVVATVLLIIEMYMPGVGIPGIAGVVFIFIGVYLAWKEHGALAGLAVLLVAIALVALAVTLSIRSTNKGRLSKSSLILKSSTNKEEGYIATEDRQDLLGKEGTSLSVLRPSGIAQFGDERLNVVSQGEFIPKDARLQIVQVDGSRLVVVNLDNQEEKNV